MISLTLYLVFILTVFIVMITPGPSVMVAVVHGMRYGWQRVIWVGLGDISANFLQMIAAVAGLGLILQTSAYAFFVIKAAGVLYLLWLGIKLLRSKAAFGVGAQAQAAPRPWHWHYRQGFIVAGTSPKAILFYGALFPQFLSPDLPLAPQFALLALTCALIDFAIILAYCWVADQGGSKLSQSGLGAWINKISGGMMLGAAGLMASLQR
ncbi:LysE family translocator [Tropicibacter sp. R15_0]|uniref:LysE family translocator n=1 Tax=Tropicibacter sp. R15_0 TaxID=2821101 RepID=UPI001ADA3B4C|nr:LysE family translocator [Tropicibacter sp. R15_0]MBO9466193.1 LysE family translocator [Tropicibacter sp. R15_0]